MHFSVGRGATKLVRCGRGAIHDVLVDVRRGSPTFGEWEGFDLTDENMRLLYIPVGFAHGFCVVSDTADVLYKQDAYYDPNTDRAIKYDDPAIGIDWPLREDELVPSERDLEAPLLKDVEDELPFTYR
jgi:dTDP-4-dehydrorhamnose 3,5-epimerase